MRLLRLASVACFGVLGCHYGFRPTISPTLKDDSDVRVRVERLSRSPGAVNVFLRIERIPASTRISEVLLVPAATEGCPSGTLASAVVVDGRDARHTEVASGAELVSEFPAASWEQVTDLAQRIDLVIDGAEGRRCVPVPLTSTTNDVAWKPERNVTVALGFEVLGQTRPSGGSLGSIGAPLYVGTWLGPVRLLGGSGFQLDLCSERLCGTTEKGARRDQVAVPIIVRADVFPVEYRGLALGVGARYAAVGTFHEYADGRRFDAYQTLALTPRFAVTGPGRTPTGFDLGLRSGSFEFEVPIGIGVGFQDFTRPAFQFGLSLIVSDGM